MYNLISFQIYLIKSRSIINHFTPKIDAWSAANHISSLTEQQVLEIVRTNYDSLTLKLEDDLDQYERYNENPNEAGFFNVLTRRIISDTRVSLSDISRFDTLNTLQALSANQKLS